MTTPPEPGAEASRLDGPDAADGEPDNADLALAGDDVQHGAEPTPGTLPDEDPTRGPEPRS